ncbi:MAG: hypothetical protein IT305_16545 [Chloroflexi bacterium]|nr:hypothetical protein [Chloroflexota bacterium]
MRQSQPSTFHDYADDVNGDGQTDVCSAGGSLFAATRYLHAHGADAEIESAGPQRALALYGVDPRPMLDPGRAYQARTLSQAPPTRLQPALPAALTDRTPRPHTPTTPTARPWPLRSRPRLATMQP